MARRNRFRVAVALLIVTIGLLLFAMSANNDFCLPWQERVSYGDGAIGPGDDFTACR
jgi:hypothetical protein